MGRLPSNGSPAFRFSSNEVAEMENILREHKAQVPSREALEALAAKFSSSEERSGKMPVQMKQVWNWFQNRRYALRAKQTMSPLVPRYDTNAARNAPQAPNAVRNVHQASQSVNSPITAQGGGRPVSDNTVMEFEAKSARDGAWYDVASFLSHRSLETDTPEVLVRFAGFGAEEDEWVNIRKHVRPRSLPCESTECVAILPGDLILCFQEGKEQALYYDAHVIDSQRRRHDVRGCRCRFLVRYDHDQSEEIVPLRKVCRRPETDYRLLQLQSMNESGATKQQKTNPDTPHMGNTLRVYPPSESTQKPQKAEESLSHGNRPIATEVKIQQKKNPQVSAGSAINPLAAPPSFETVTSGTAKDNNATGDTPADMKANSLEKSNPDVIMPVATEVESLETKVPEVSTPLASEVKNLQTENPEKSAGDGVVATPVVPPGFEAVTSGTADSPKKSAGDGVIATPVAPLGFKVVTGGTVNNNSTCTDTPIAMEVKSIETEKPTSANVTDGITSGNTPIAPVVKSLEMEISTIPPGFEDVASGNAPVAMEIESLEAKTPEVTAGDVSAHTSVAMEVEAPKTKDPEVSVAAVNTDVSDNMLEG